MSERIWIGFKAVLSALLLTAPIALAVAAPRAITDPVFIGMVAVLLFFAALPWIDPAGPGRPWALAGVFASLVIGGMAAHDATSGGAFPRECGGRRSLTCHVANLLHAVGGPWLAAAPWALLACALFFWSVRALIRARRWQ